MKRNAKIGMVAGAAVIAALILTVLFLPPGPVEEPVINETGGSEPAINESGAREILNESYPGLEFDLEFRESCEENAGRSCWDAEVEGGSGGGKSVLIDSGTGRIVKFVIIYCNHSYTDVLPGGEVYYYNMGCDNPLPVCDMNTGTCRECISKSECLRKRTSRFITGVPEQVFTWHGYEIIGTGVEGSFNELSQVCRVSYEGSELYTGVLSMTECEGRVLSYSECSAGRCVKQ